MGIIGELTVIVDVRVASVSELILVHVLLVGIGDGRTVVTSITLLVWCTSVSVRLVWVVHQETVVLNIWYISIDKTI